MSDNISEILKTISGHFGILAEEIDKMNNETNYRLIQLENQASKNNETLKAAASLILENLK